MTKKILYILGVVTLALPSYAQQPVGQAHQLPLAINYDLDGGALDVDFVMTASTIVADKVNYAISGGIVDSCRLIDITIADTDIGVGEGAVAVTGTDCLGTAKVCSWSAWTAADDDGVKTLTCTDGGSAYYSTITSATTMGTYTNATDETVAIGYSTAPGKTWFMYGTKWVTPEGVQGVDPFGIYPVATKITTSGSSTTVTGTGAFTNVSQWDLLRINLNGNIHERIVIARASANSITVDKAINISPTGVPFIYKKRYVSSDSDDQLWLRPLGWDAALWIWNQTSGTNTGGVVFSLECAASAGFDSFSPSFEVVTDTMASGATDGGVQSIDLNLARYRACRFSAKFGTNDDTDATGAAVEALTVSVALDAR